MSDVILPNVRRFPVEEGHIKLFARSLGDPNPIYSDVDYAKRSKFGGVIAPPTFSEAANHFDENWPFRPRFGEPWFGSGREPTGTPQTLRKSGTAMHAETQFTYFRPLRAGMVLSARSREGRQWEKWGARSGKLTFSEIVSTFIDEQGDPMLECSTIALRTERIVDDGAGAENEDSVAAQLPQENSAYSGPERAPDLSALPIGARLRRAMVENLTRTQIIQYAGASGDFSPQHTDEIFNTRVAGYPTIFAHGMLTMGLLGRVLTDVVGDGALRTFGFQSRRQVWPGDSLFAELELIARENAMATLNLMVKNEKGQLVGKGYASALLG
ncbi:MaoC/PaaZ C-terminal domain-containing protein [Terrarubrum flagellatum]|uniref:MaoC/PaaZ C-terminal domain-containing protein n=1 Tax=Terrirubrum flagellatum TaxID=2895980 RepID=UPI00314500A9